MVGLGGNDRYVVDEASDQVIEAAGGGSDTVLTRASYVLAAGQDIEALAAIDEAATTAIDLTGNEKVQTLTGNKGANLLDGKAGADTMAGLGGDDMYVVDEIGDRVIEAAGGGSDDRVLASLSYTLAAGQEIEVLATIRYAGGSAINLTGNEFAQTIIGNSGANVLDGKAGADLLQGSVGTDTFVFSTALGTGNVDRIADFAAADDTIQLSRSIFAALGAGPLGSAAFKDLGASGASVDADDRILYNSTTGALSYDADGSGTTAAVQFALIDTRAALSATNFLVA